MAEQTQSKSIVDTEGKAPPPARKSFVQRVKSIFVRSDFVNGNDKADLSGGDATPQHEVEHTGTGDQYNTVPISGFKPGFGHKGAGLAARGRRVETIDEDARVSALNEQAKQKIHLLNDLRGEEIIEDYNAQQAAWATASDPHAVMRRKLEQEAAGASAIQNPIELPEALLKDHDRMMRDKLRKKYPNAITRRIAGYFAGVDTSIREGEPEYIEMQRKKAAIEAKKISDEAKRKKRFDEAQKLKKPSKIVKFFKKFLPVAVHDRAAPSTDKEMRGRAKLEARELEHKLNVIREEQKEYSKTHKITMNILEQVVEAYTFAPERNKRVKFPAHHYDSETQLPDFNRHYFEHDSNNRFTADDLAIPGVAELMKDRPDLFLIDEAMEDESQFSPRIASPDYKKGYNYAGYFRRKRNQEAQAFQAREKLFLGKSDEESITTLFTPNSEILGEDQNILAAKIKERKKEIEMAYRQANIPNPWRDREYFIPFEANEEPNLTMEEVKEKFEYRNYIPGYIYQNRNEGGNKIYAFPPVADQSDPVADELAEKKKRAKKLKNEVEYEYTPGVDMVTHTAINNKATNSGPRYVWDPVKNEYQKPDSCTYKDNNPRDPVFEPANTDVLIKALYKHRKDIDKVYPETTLLPSKRDMMATNAKLKSALMKENKPIVKFKMHAIDMGRTEVRLNHSDPIAIGIAKKRLFLKLRKGMLTRLEFDEQLSTIEAGKYVDTRGTGLADNYGDYPDDAYNSSDGEWDEEDKGDDVFDAEGGQSVMGGESVAGETSLAGGGSLEGSIARSRRSRQSQRSKQPSPPKSPKIISSIMDPIIPMTVLTTKGTGGKFADLKTKPNAENTGVMLGEFSNRANRGLPQRVIKITKAGEEKPKAENAFYLNNIDLVFETDKKKLIDFANMNNIELSDADVRAAGDLYKDETRTMVAQRQLYEEDSLPAGRHLVKVNMSRHRGVLKLDNKHISRSDHRTRDFSLESRGTQNHRKERMQSKKMLKIKLKEAKSAAAVAKKEADAAFYERQRENNRKGV